jgi:hypothetical protein
LELRITNGGLDVEEGFAMAAATAVRIRGSKFLAAGRVVCGISMAGSLISAITGGAIPPGISDGLSRGGRLGGGSLGESIRKSLTGSLTGAWLKFAFEISGVDMGGTSSIGLGPFTNEL